MKSIISIFIFYILGFSFIKSQKPIKSDSLQSVLAATKDEKKKVDLLYEIGMEYEDSQPEIAAKFYKDAFKISNKINYEQGKLKYFKKYANVLFVRGKTDSVKILFFESLKLSKKMKDSLEIATSLLNIGKIYLKSGDYLEANDYIAQSRLLYSKFGKTKEEAIAFNHLQLLSYFTHNYNNAVNYGLQAIQKSKIANDEETQCSSYNNIAISYIKLQDYQKAKYYLELANSLAIKQNNQIVKALYFLNHADIDYSQGHFSLLKNNLDASQKILQPLGNNEYLALIDWGYAIYYLARKENKTAEQYANKSLAIADKLQSKDTQAKALSMLSQISFANQNMEAGFAYAKQYENLRDKILNESVAKSNAYFEKKFELHKKQNQIKLQQAQIKNKNILNYIAFGSILALSAILFLVYRNYNHRKILQTQRITELETEKKLLATQSLLKGQEEERSRLAKDLHDGLGGMLSGVKLQLGSMKGNLILSEENKTTFDRALLKLDESIGEMRRVAYNMMPESLLKSGLKQAILDYCHALDQNQDFVINCELHGIDEKMDSATEVVLYRIIQELVNNAVKHSKASQILVQVLKDDHHNISITVEDNGKGFNTEKNNVLLSSGMRSIHSRVNYLKGTMDVKSEIGKGTSIYIECKKENYG